MNRRELLRFYQGTRWRAVARAAKVRDDFLCVRCRREGRTVEARVVHHIRPVLEDDDKKLDLENCESLCKICHESHHGRGPSKERKAWNHYMNYRRIYE